MNKNNFGKIAVFLTVAILGFFIGKEIAFAYSTIHNGYQSTPIYVECYLNFEADTKTAISNACTEWNNAGAGNLVYKSGTEHSMTIYPIQNTENHITKGSRGTDKYLMQATNFIVNGYSTETDIDINVSHPFGTAGSQLVFDIQNCMTHEIGHLLGLADLRNTILDTNKTMYFECTKGETKKRTLEQDDKDGILSLYKK